ncbi:MAG: glycosyltransferase family 39 protein [Rudaea sp.]
MGSSIGNVNAGMVPPPARDGYPWATLFWAAWTLTLGAHVVLAMTLSPFGDEAWYWQESRALDISFSDIPPATALLINLGEKLFGHGVFGMRSLFIVLGALIPIVMMRMSRRLFGETNGWMCGLLALALPLLGIAGVLALPDVPLTFFTAIALDQLERASRTNKISAWVALGIALAGAWLSHYRAAMLLVAGFCFFLTMRGRVQWRKPGLWIALGISCIGLFPLVLFNMQHDWVALHFQTVERNPWTFHGDAIAQPIEQAIVCTPVFYALMMWAAWQCLRRVKRGAPWGPLAICAAVPLVLYFVLGFFADDTRFRVHWPIPGYLPLLIALPMLIREHIQRRWFRWFATCSFVSLAIGLVCIYAYLGAATSPPLAQRLASVKAFPEHVVGWNEASNRTRELAANLPPDTVIVADNFMLAAELDFAFDGTRTVYSLDHPINTKHGRAPQLAMWKRDEAGLRELGKRNVLLIAEPTARRERERADWMQSLCSRIDDLQPVASLDPFGGRKKYRWFSGTISVTQPAVSACQATMP